MARRLVARALVPLMLAAAPATTTTAPKGGNSDQVALGPQTPATVDAAAVRVGSLRDALTALNARQVDLQNQLATATQVTADRRAALDDATRIATDTLLKARQQALTAYMFGDPSASQEAIIRSIFAESPGDALWGVTMVHIVAAERDAIARSAAQARTQADAQLVDATAAQEKLATDLAAVGPQITDTEAQLQQAQLDLITVVIRLGQSTIEGLTTVAYDAYTRTARALGEEQPKCGLRWELLAAIGRTESNHGAGRIDANGDTTPILGPPIGPDTDGGEWDTDPTQDHAVGPMQFIPSTWRKWGADGNADTRTDPNNIFDETLAAGRYLCAAAGELTLLTREGVAAAIWSYNPNEEYLRLVGARFEALANDLAAGWFSGANLPVPPDASVADPGGVTGGGTAPPADPPPPPRPATEVRELALFGPDGLPVVAGEVPASCEAQTWLLAPRAEHGPLRDPAGRRLGLGGPRSVRGGPRRPDAPRVRRRSDTARARRAGPRRGAHRRAEQRAAVLRRRADRWRRVPAVARRGGATSARPAACHHHDGAGTSTGDDHDDDTRGHDHDDDRAHHDGADRDVADHRAGTPAPTDRLSVPKWHARARPTRHVRPDVDRAREPARPVTSRRRRGRGIHVKLRRLFGAVSLRSVNR